MTLQKVFQQAVCFCSREPEVVGNKFVFATDPGGEITEQKGHTAQKELTCIPSTSSGFRMPIR